MTPYQHDMNDESKPNIKKLLDKGWRKFTITNCEEAISKGGNEMFIMTFTDEETGYEDTIYAISVKGKRWFLKSILIACNIEAGQDGVYDWDIKDIINVEIAGLVEHEPNEYINRQGDTVKTTQHRIAEVKKPASVIRPTQ